MAGDYGKFKVGSVVYPLSTSLANNTLQGLDPGIFEALDYFTAMLQLHMGQVWDQVLINLGRPEFVGKVVNYQLPYDPTSYFREQQAQFPLLSVWRTDSMNEERTFSWYHTRETWKVSYSLFPMTSAELEILNPFLKASRDIISDRAEQGYDPNYFDKKQVWSDGYAGIEKLRVTQTKFSNLIFAEKSNLIFPTMLMTLEVTFRETFQRNFLSELSGINTTQLLDGYQFLQTQDDFG